jgi:hypothetical protein
MTHYSLLVIAVLATAPARGSTQVPDSGRMAAVQTLKVGQHVRLAVSQVGRVEGSFMVANDNSITLAGRDSSSQYLLPGVEQLWVRGRATGKGALIGAGVGVLIGVVSGLIFSSVACEPIDGGNCTPAELAAVAGLLGGTGGALVGAGIGFAIPTWRLRFP